MDLKLLEEKVCQGFRRCLDCRNSLRAREEFFRNGYVDQIDFPCPHGIPIDEESILPVRRSPKAHPIVVSDEVKRRQELVSQIPDAIRNLRQLVTAEARPWVDLIEDALFPQGIKDECVYKQKTGKIVCGKSSEDTVQIYCCCPSYNTAQLFLTDEGCTVSQCSHFRSTDKTTGETNNV
jgi:hypothetical protein